MKKLLVLQLLGVDFWMAAQARYENQPIKKQIEWMGIITPIRCFAKLIKSEYQFDMSSLIARELFAIFNIISNCTTAECVLDQVDSHFDDFTKFTNLFSVFSEEAVLLLEHTPASVKTDA